MPRLIDYAHVLAHAVEKLGLVSAYYNSGAFTYPPGEAIEIVGWIGPEDASIRPALQPATVRVAPPFEANLAQHLAGAWREALPGDAWVLPKAHWSFELEHGHGGWMTTALEEAGIDPATLRGVTNAPAVAFGPEESPAFERFVEHLLTHLLASDFAVLFPGYRHLVTLHHHKQVWWQTPDPQLAQRLKSRV